MGLERLGPGVPAPRGAALALQMLLTNLAERLTPRAQQPAQEGALVVQAEGLKGLRDRTHRMAGRRGKSRRVRLGHPRGRGPRVPGGTGAMPARARRLARHAALPTPLRLPPERGRATGEERVDDLGLGRGDLRALPRAGAREADEGGASPRGRAAPGGLSPCRGQPPRAASPHAATALGRASGPPSRATGRWTVATCCRVRGRYRGVGARLRWPRRRCMVCRATPAASRGGAQQWRHVWLPWPGVRPASRLGWEESCWARALARGWGRSGAGKSQGAGREQCQEARSVARRRVASPVERSCRPLP